MSVLVARYGSSRRLGRRWVTEQRHVLCEACGTAVWAAVQDALLEALEAGSDGER